nr:hypothetical protein [Coxiella-like endosymbiont]
MESIASVFQLHKEFIHGPLNCEDIHPELEVFQDRIIQQTQEKSINILAKSIFGFGDVNIGHENPRVNTQEPLR